MLPLHHCLLELTLNPWEFGGKSNQHVKQMMQKMGEDLKMYYDIIDYFISALQTT